MFEENNWLDVLDEGRFVRIFVLIIVLRMVISVVYICKTLYLLLVYSLFLKLF